MRSRGGVPWVRTLSAVLVGAGLLVGGCAGDDGGDRARAEASPKPPVELNDELTVANVAVEHEKPCRKNELEHTSMCYRLGDGFSTRRVKNLQLLLSYQLVDHFDTEDQTIFSANYDLNQSDAIGGRFVKRNSDMNFYIAFRRAGNRGNEYFLILGDPNAQTFRPSLILKATFPLQVKF